MNVDGRKQRNWEKRKMQENNDRQEQKVARRTYMAHALLTALVVNITWLVDVSVRLLVYPDLKTFLPWFELYYGADSLQECIRRGDSFY